MVVEDTLKNIGLNPLHVELGEVIIQEEDITDIKAEITSQLNSLGFELLDDKKI